MPMLDVNEISQSIVIEKPRMLLLLGKRAVTSNVQRQLETAIRSRAIRISKSVCKSTAPLDGAKRRCAAQRV